MRQVNKPRTIASIALILLIITGAVISWMVFSGTPGAITENQEKNASQGAGNPSVISNSNGNAVQGNPTNSNVDSAKFANPPKLSKSEYKRLANELRDKEKQLKEPRRGNKDNTVESVWKWWEAMIALQDEYIQKIPEMEEVLLSTKVGYDQKALALIQSVNITRMNPVQRQEKYDAEDKLAAVYARHIDEYLAKATNEDGIRAKQFAKASLLEHFDINNAPYAERTAKSGESFESAYDSGLREGTCLLRTAKFAAEKFADAYEYDKAIAFLEKASTDAKSGNYEVRDLGPLNPVATIASLADIKSMIAKYEQAKPLAEEKRKKANEYDRMMEEQIASDRAEVEEYKKRIERGEVPAQGLPGKGVQYNLLGRPIAADDTAPVAGNANAVISEKGENKSIASEESTDGSVDSLRKEAFALEQKGDYLGASEKFRQTGNLEAAAAILNKGVFMLGNSADSNDWPRALELQEKLLQAYPGTSSATDAPFEAAKLYEKLGRDQDAISVLNKWLDANPDDYRQQGARMMQVKLHMKANRPQDALNTLLPMYEKYKASGIPPEQICAMVAGAYGACGDVNSSIAVWEDFKQRVSTAPPEALGADSPELNRVRVLEHADAQIAILKGNQ